VNVSTKLWDEIKDVLEDSRLRFLEIEKCGDKLAGTYFNEDDVDIDEFECDADARKIVEILERMSGAERRPGGVA